MKTRRSLALRKDSLAELTTEELDAVAAGEGIELTIKTRITCNIACMTMTSGC